MRGLSFKIFELQKVFAETYGCTPLTTIYIREAASCKSLSQL